MKRLFSTQFPIRSSATLDELLKVEKEWIAGSSHSRFSSKDLEQLKKENSIIQRGQNTIEICSVAYKNPKSQEPIESLGMRYTVFEEEGDIYKATIVGSKSSRDFWVSTVVDYDSGTPKITGPGKRKPVIVKQILDKIGGGLDGDIKVTNEPINLKEEDIEFVADILKGRTPSIMPIFYVSADEMGLHSVNPLKLADISSGVVNVLVEPSNAFSFRLKESMRQGTVYRGAVGIYFPDGLERYFWLPHELKKEDPEKKIYERVVEALSLRRLRKGLTWENMEQINHDRQISEIRKEAEIRIKGMTEEGQKELAEYMGTFDEEVARLKTEKAEQEERMEALEIVLRREKAQSSYGGELIQVPQTNQLYEGEIKNIVLEILGNHVRQNATIN
jgi:hypothetical protein